MFLLSLSLLEPLSSIVLRHQSTKINAISTTTHLSPRGDPVIIITYHTPFIMWLFTTYSCGNFVSRSCFCWTMEDGSSFSWGIVATLGSLSCLSGFHVIQDSSSLDLYSGACGSGGGGVLWANQSTLGGWGWATEDPVYSKCFKSSVQYWRRK